MKKLVVYASKYGFTEKCVGILRDSLPEFQFWNLRQTAPGAWREAESVIVGGPIYAGHLWKPLKQWIRKEEAWGQGRIKGLFVTALSDRESAQGYLVQNFPESWFQDGPVQGIFGGGLDFSRLGWLESFLLRRIMGLKEDVSNLDLAEIRLFAQNFRA